MPTPAQPCVGIGLRSTIDIATAVALDLTRYRRRWTPEEGCNLPDARTAAQLSRDDLTLFDGEVTLVAPPKSRGNTAMIVNATVNVSDLSTELTSNLRHREPMLPQTPQFLLFCWCPRSAQWSLSDHATLLHRNAMVLHSRYDHAFALIFADICDGTDSRSKPATVGETA
jgi:hypothetical protein